MRQPPLIRSYAVTHPPGGVRFPQDPEWHQFIHARRGVVRIDTDAGSWTLPPERALWLAAGVEHRATVVRRASMRTLYSPRPFPLLDEDIAVVDVSPLVRELVVRIADRAPIALDTEGRAWWTVLAAEVRALDVPALRLPSPASGPARDAAALLHADPGRTDSLAELASLVGVSARTLERSFRAGTGMTGAQWRTRLRMLTAVEQLAAGTSVGRVAADLGYSTQSAFGAAFLRELGTSPGTYFTR